MGRCPQSRPIPTYVPSIVPHEYHTYQTYIHIYIYISRHGQKQYLGAPYVGKPLPSLLIVVLSSPSNNTCEHAMICQNRADIDPVLLASGRYRPVLAHYAMFTRCAMAVHAVAWETRCVHAHATRSRQLCLKNRMINMMTTLKQYPTR